MNTVGIFPAAIDASCLALYHVFENHPWIRKRRNFAIIDVRSCNTELLILKDGEPFASTEISCGIKGKTRENYDIATQVLAVKLQKTLHFYRNSENLNIEGLILVGDYSKVPGLKKNLTSILGIKTVNGNPFCLQNVDLPSGFNRKHCHHYAQAFGLALKGLKSYNSINLMPPETKEKYGVWRFKKRARSFFKKNMIVTGILTIVFLFLLNMVVNRHQAIAKDVEELKLQRNELLYVNNEEKELKSKVIMFRQLNSERFLWSQILSHIGNAVPEGLYFKEISTEFRLVAAGRKPVKKRKVVIEGEARNNEAVIRFIKNLETYFEHIGVDKIKEESGCEFKISLTL